MPNQIIPVVWEKPLRKSAVNTLDKLNEVIDFINTSDIHEFSFIDGDTGREVVSGTSTQLATLDVFGECVQDGTPTPDNPVPVQVVSGVNLIPYPYMESSHTGGGITWTDNADGTFTVNGTDASNAWCALYGANTTTLQLLSPLPNTIQPGDVLTFASNANSSDVTMYVQFNDETGQLVLGGGGAITARTITVPATAKYIYIGLRVNNGATVDNVIIKPMVQHGTIATQFVKPGSICLQIGNDITPIDLQGNVLASLPDGTQDVLRVDSAGVVTLDKRVGVVDLGTLDWTYNASLTRFNATTAISDAEAPDYANLLCDALTVSISPVSDRAIDNTICLYNNGAVYAVAKSYTDPAAFKTAMSGVLLYYELAIPQTIELGTITPPPIPSDSVIKIAASLQPEFDIQWWTESSIPSVINGLKAYVNEQIETVNARIDELHGITRAAAVRPDASIPAIEFEPIEKITVNETETDVEKEN